MSREPRRQGFAAVALTAAAGVTLAPLALLSPASATPAGDQLVISEVYGGGGNSGATYTHDFIELYNPTDEAISLEGMSLQYRAAGNTTSAPGLVYALEGSVPSGGHWLVRGASQNASVGAPLPAEHDDDISLNMGGSAGQIFLAGQTTPLQVAGGDLSGTEGMLDLLGWGTTAAAYETAPGPATSATASATRDGDGGDTDDNSSDYVRAEPDPAGSGSEPDPDPDPEPEPEPEPSDATIAEIQGSGGVSPMLDQAVTTTGVVTATYPTGGFDGFYLQTEGTGGDVDLASHDASHGVFVYSAAGAAAVRAGDLVEVTGTVAEYYGLTQVVPSGADDVTVLEGTPQAVKPAVLAWPTTDAARETLEGMLLEPQGAYTVSNTYALNQYAEIGLASGDRPLLQPTDVARPGSEGYHAQVADNAARAVALDDGATTNFLSQANKGIPLPYLTTQTPVRVDAAVTFVAPVVVDYRNNTWKLQPTGHLTADDRNGVAPAVFENDRTAAPENVGGDVRIGTFNVLNYFNTTGEEYTASGLGSCSYYTDREGNRITVNSCTNNGPRGAADAENLARQQAKIVAAVNALGTDVVSLEEIENSVRLGKDRDAALAHLVDALNADAGEGTWAFVPSPAAEDLPPLAEQDVIRSAFIYKPAAVSLVGASRVLVGSPAFGNAREPLAQVFEPTGGAETDRFAVIVNHFKSKGSGSGDDADQGDGQGGSNASRVAQAEGLVSFADEFAAEREVEKVFLSGDFNSYTYEDPMQVLYDAGYTNLKSDQAGESTYSFAGQSGSLDHVLANGPAIDTVTGVDIWSINSGEPVALEYSRYNYNATLFYEPTPYRASDHDPEVVGIALDEPPAPLAPSTTEARARPFRYGTEGIVEVFVTSEAEPFGTVEVRDGSRLLGTGEVHGGKAVVLLEAGSLEPGRHLLQAAFLGDGAVAPSATTVWVNVRQAR